MGDVTIDVMHAIEFRGDAGLDLLSRWGSASIGILRRSQATDADLDRWRSAQEAPILSRGAM